MAGHASDQIRQHAAQHYVSRARESGLQEFEIVVGMVVREMQLKNRTPQVCAALRSEKFLRENQLVLVGESGPPSGMSTTVRLRYRFSDEAGSGEPSATPSASPSHAELTVYQGIRELYGIAGDLYRKLGGSDRVLKEERESFFGNPSGPNPSEPEAQ